MLPIPFDSLPGGTSCDRRKSTCKLNACPTVILYCCLLLKSDIHVVDFRYLRAFVPCIDPKDLLNSLPKSPSSLLRPYISTLYAMRILHVTRSESPAYKSHYGGPKFQPERIMHITILRATERLLHCYTERQTSHRLVHVFQT